MTNTKTSNDTFRTETDSMGDMLVPQDALWGASTQRAVENFPIAHKTIPTEVIHAFGHLKAACAQVNMEIGKLDELRAKKIIKASKEVAQGKHDKHFVVDVYQTGSGTSSNMNANEVIANLANSALTEKQKEKVNIHPNDHVNMGQSSNDTFPTAMHIGAALALKSSLIPELKKLHTELNKKAKKWDDIVKIGRTHLMDATPIRVGQVFSGYARQAELAVTRAQWALSNMRQNMPIGGTAVGTGINTHPKFGCKVCQKISESTGIQFEETKNHREAQAAKDWFIEAHGSLKTIAVSLSKIANDIRHLGSGPRCGLGELQLPSIQPGSSIMPGKVNPVLCETVVQVSCRVIGNDAAITTGALGGVGSIFELNIAMPMMVDAFLESIHLLANSTNVFVEKLVKGLEVNKERCEGLIENSLMTVTSLAPEIGYDKASKIAKKALAQDTTIREEVKAEGLIDDKKLDKLLDPRSMTEPK